MGYQQQLNRVTTRQDHQLCNERLNLHNSTPTEKRNQSSTYTNLSTSTRYLSSAIDICTHSGLLQLLVTFTSVYHYPICTITNLNTSILSNNILILLNHVQYQFYSTISNQYTIATISVLKHKSATHSINQST